MSMSFDQDYWESHWREAPKQTVFNDTKLNPHLVRVVNGIPHGTALDAGSGAGVEAIWLARAGWSVTAVDISSEAQDRAAEREAQNPPEDPVDWVVADLETWQPDRQFDLVCTHYAHPSGPQLEFYERISNWVAPGGMLLIVGHLHNHNHDHDDHRNGECGGPPPEASVRADDVVALLGNENWSVKVAEESHRSIGKGSDRAVELHDVFVSAVRTDVESNIELRERAK